MRRRNENVYSFTSEITAMGLTPSSTLVEFDVITPTPDIIRIFSLPSRDTKVYRFTRIRRVDGTAMLETSLPPVYLSESDTRPAGNAFVLLPLFAVGIIPSTALDTYEAVRLSHDEAELLGCKSGSAVFFISAKRKRKTGKSLSSHSH